MKFLLALGLTLALTYVKGSDESDYVRYLQRPDLVTYYDGVVYSAFVVGRPSIENVQNFGFYGHWCRFANYPNPEYIPIERVSLAAVVTVGHHFYPVYTMTFIQAFGSYGYLCRHTNGPHCLFFVQCANIKFRTLLVNLSDVNNRNALIHLIKSGYATVEDVSNYIHDPRHEQWRTELEINRGSSALCVAIDLEKNKIASMLIENGAYVSEKDIDNNTPMHYAADRGNLAIIKKLASFNAPLDVQNKAGYSPLHWAVHSNEIVEELIKLKADMNVRHHCENSLKFLQFAVNKGSRKIVETLIIRGADLDDEDDVDALDLALDDNLLKEDDLRELFLCRLKFPLLTQQHTNHEFFFVLEIGKAQI